jgi:trk system potassium uptake protein TrkH
LFETVSGFTSTGFTIFDEINYMDQGLILWRSSIQWIGGLYFLFSIIFLIDIYDESLKKSLTNFLSFNSSEILRQTIKIFLLYSGLTIVIFIILNITGIRSFNSLNLAMTIISSGGFLPTNELSSILDNNTQIVVFSVLMLVSFFSIFFIYNLIFLRDKNLNFFYEDIHLFLYFIIIVTIFLIFFSFDNNFTHSFLSLTSSISNIGISLKSDQTNLNFIYLILVIIGGSFFSTSSGLRFLKIYALTKYSLNQILSFSKPKNIFMNKLMFSKINFDFREINKYFLTIVIFIISLFVLTSILSLSGINFEGSFKLSILTLMNTVTSSTYGIDDFDFQNLYFLTKYFLIFFMIIGRVELLSLLLIAKKFLFKY